MFVPSRHLRPLPSGQLPLLVSISWLAVAVPPPVPAVVVVPFCWWSLPFLLSAVTAPPSSRGPRFGGLDNSSGCSRRLGSEVVQTVVFGPGGVVVVVLVAAGPCTCTFF
jgi:hypothetical protein